MSFILYKHKMSQDVSTLTRRKRKRKGKGLKLSVIYIRLHSPGNFRESAPRGGEDTHRQKGGGEEEQRTLEKGTGERTQNNRRKEGNHKSRKVPPKTK